MGILKKIFKPVSKVLDKIIPNEIKPALPYLAAFAPYMMGPTSGIMGSGMLQRALVSGGFNIGAQLAQEGNEGDINLLSAGLGALQGAMTAPNAASKFQSMKLGQVPTPEAQMMGSDAGWFNAAGIKPDMMVGKDLNMFQKAANYGLEGLAKGSEFIEKMQGSDKLVDKLKLYAAPATQATGDLMYAEANRLEDDEDQGSEESSAGYSDAAYRAAIRKSMEAYGATEEEILAAIEAAGYRSGGRVGYGFGDLVSKSATAQPGARSINMGGSGLGGMIPNLINNNAQLLASLRPSPTISSPLLDASVVNKSIDFIDENRNVIDDREESDDEEFVQVAASGGRITPKRGLVDGPGGYAGEIEFGGITEAVENVDGKEKEKITEAYDSESDMSQWRIGDYRPFKYTGAVDDMWKLNLDEGSPLEYIFKIGMTVRAPLIDVIRGAGKTAAETAKLIAAAGELGWDLTKPARDILKDVGAAGLEGTKWALGHSDKFRFAQKPYLALRMTGMSDDEARLKLQDTHIGDFRKDKDLINKLENKLMNEKVGESPDQISMEEVELYPGRGEKTSRMSLRAYGGRINKAEGGMPSVLPKGIEADYRGGGFIPIGSRERADDVPARLSENEFVMTADAVRAAGGGSVNKGAKRMYDLMHNLEARA